MVIPMIGREPMAAIVLPVEDFAFFALFYPKPETEKQSGHEMPVI
jgi:hypothetical protein